MTITVRGPNGVQVNFPEGTDTATISRVMSQFGGQQEAQAPALDVNRPEAEVRADIEKLPKQQRKQANRKLAEKLEAEESAKLREAGLEPSNWMVNVLRGTPAGSWLDEADAGVSSLINLASGGKYGRPYDEAVEISRARNRRIDNEATKLGTLPVIGDVTTSGVQKLAGGVLSAPVSPLVRLFGGTTALPFTGNLIATGGVYGGLYGAGEGEGGDTVAETAWNRVKPGAVGAGIGAGTGVVLGPTARGLSNLYEYAMNAFRPMPQQLQGYAPEAVRKVARGFEGDDFTHLAGERVRRSDNVTNNTQPGQGRDLALGRVIRQTPNMGDDAMLVDYGPNMFAQGDILANVPGPQQQMAREAMRLRSDLRPARIADDVNSIVGPVAADDIVAQQAVQDANRAAAPLYDQFHNTPINANANPRLVALLDRARRAGAYDRAARLMEIDGVDPNQAGNNGLFLDYIKRGLDDLAGKAERAGEREGLMRFGNLARELRTEVDQMLVSQGAVARDAAGQPIMRNGRPVSIWEEARFVSGEGKNLRDAIELGNRVLDNNISEAQLAAELQGMSPPEIEAVRQGLRNKIRTLQVSSTRDGQVINPLESIDAGAKIRLVLGNDRAADRLVNRFSAERRMMNTEQNMFKQSATAPREAAKREIGIGTDGAADNLSGLRNANASGMLAEGVMRIANAMRSGAITESRMNTARDMVRMLFAQGAERDQVIAGLRAYINSQGVTAAQRARFERNIVRLVDSVRPANVAAATAERPKRQPLEVVVGPRRD